MTHASVDERERPSPLSDEAHVKLQSGLWTLGGFLSLGTLELSLLPAESALAPCSGKKNFSSNGADVKGLPFETQTAHVSLLSAYSKCLSSKHLPSVPNVVFEEQFTCRFCNGHNKPRKSYSCLKSKVTSSQP